MIGKYSSTALIIGSVAILLATSAPSFAGADDSGAYIVEVRGGGGGGGGHGGGFGGGGFGGGGFGGGHGGGFDGGGFGGHDGGFGAFGGGGHGGYGGGFHGGFGGRDHRGYDGAVYGFRGGHNFFEGDEGFDGDWYPYGYGGYYDPNQSVGYGVDPETAAYCRSRFKSYDPASGTYLGYDGQRHYCE